MVLDRKIMMKVFLAQLFLVVSTVTIHAQNIEKIIHRETQALWSDAELIQVSLDTKVLKSCDELHSGDKFYRIIERENSSLNGYVLSTSAMGRFDAFDYFIIYKESMEVHLVKVGVYRSSHGSAICSKRWLKQFVGKKTNEINYGKEIDAIAGATVSANALVFDIQMLSNHLKSINHLINVE